MRREKNTERDQLKSLYQLSFDSSATGRYAVVHLHAKSTLSSSSVHHHENDQYLSYTRSGDGTWPKQRRRGRDWTRHRRSKCPLAEDLLQNVQRTLRTSTQAKHWTSSTARTRKYELRCPTTHSKMLSLRHAMIAQLHATTVKSKWTAMLFLLSDMKIKNPQAKHGEFWSLSIE